jgi:protein SCO1
VNVTGDETMKNRRQVIAAGAGALALSAAGFPTRAEDEGCERPARGPDAHRFPNHVVVTHEGARALFYDDLLAGKTVLIHCMSVATEAVYRTAECLARLQHMVGDRLGRDLFFYSLTVDPERDTPMVLKELAAQYGACAGWLFLTGETAVMHDLRDRLYQESGHVHDGERGCSMALLRYGNAAVGLWGSVPARTEPEWIAQRLSWVQGRAIPQGRPRRRGPAPLRV